MKASLLATVSTVALSTGVSAADLPVKAPLLPAAEVWSWAGPYIGINAGVAQHHSKFFDLGDPTCCQFAFPAGGSFYTAKKSGLTAGAQAGYNWQFGNVVFGVEADGNWVDGKKSAIVTSPFGVQVTANADLDWYTSVRGRVGLAFSRALIYVTGGVAVAQVSNDWGYLTSPQPRFNYKETRAAGIIGGGVEYMLTKNWLARVEGFYANFGTSPIATVSGFGGNYRSNFTHTLAVVRGGVGWKW
jgi:outer membrane immunogenic protein